MKKETANLYCAVIDLMYFSGKFDLKPSTTYTLIIDYPLKNDYYAVLDVPKKGMNSLELLAYIGEQYKNIFEIRNQEKYGVYGHELEDLVLESVTVDHTRKTIKLGVGS